MCATGASTLRTTHTNRTLIKKEKKETKRLLLCTVTETYNVWKNPVNFLQHCTMHILVAFLIRIPKSQPTLLHFALDGGWISLPCKILEGSGPF